MKIYRVEKITARGSNFKLFTTLYNAYKYFKSYMGTDIYLDNIITNKTLLTK